MTLVPAQAKGTTPPCPREPSPSQHLLAAGSAWSFVARTVE